MEPTAESTGAQSSSFTTALVTVSTGIGCFLVAMVTICRTLIPARMRNSATTAKVALINVLRVDFTLPFIVSGLATSCIHSCRFGAKQHAPQFSRHLNLLLTLVAARVGRL